MGWSYSIVNDNDAFTQELRSGVYSTYMLLPEHIDLEEQVQKELREAVYRGEGLIAAGDHDQRQDSIDEALGIRFKGKHKRMTDIVLLESGLHPAATGSLALTDQKQSVRTKGASVNGVFMAHAVQTEEPRTGSE